MTKVGGSYFLFGGEGTHLRNNVRAFHPTSNPRWDRFAIDDASTEVPPEGRFGHTANAFKHWLIVYGGMGRDKRDCPINRLCFPLVHVLDTHRRRWLNWKPNGYMPEGRRNHGSVVIGSTMIIFGGRNHYDQILNDIVCIDLERVQWFYPKIYGKKQTPDPIHSFSMTPMFHSSVLTNFTKSFWKVKKGYDGRFTKANSGMYVFGG
jgi:hypothetical protein